MAAQQQQIHLSLVPPPQPQPQPQPNPPGSSVLGEEVLDFSNAELCPAEEEFYMPLNDGDMEEATGEDPRIEEMQSTDLSFQVFPGPLVGVVPVPAECSLHCGDRDHQKERLPSIVVEPTELSEVESGELRWPPEGMVDREDEEEEEEDLFLEQCIPPANIADWGDEEDEEEEEEGEGENQAEEDEEERSVIPNHQQGPSLIGKWAV
ncbi:hypothetical protein CRUP_012228 [Coryphaenoides rupestris]|nr:hypothetical protein CRUP_012228 [Coryphaenoides rupestris]